MNVEIPREWFEKRRQRKAEEHVQEESSRTEVEVYVLDFKVDPTILWSADTIPIGLDPNKDVVTQLKNFNTSFLGCKVGSVWKVNKADRVIKKIV